MTPDLYRLVENLSREVTIPENGIVSRTLFQDDHLKVVVFGFSPGQEMSEHAAPVPAIMHVLDGRARFTLGEETRWGEAGWWVHMAPNLSHSVHAETAMTMLLFLLKSARPTVPGEQG